MDQKLFFTINQDWASPTLDRVMAIASSLDFWMPILVLLIVAVALLGGFKARALLLTLALTVTVNEAIVGGILKPWVNRPRPHQAVEGARVVTLARKKPALLAAVEPIRVKPSKISTEAVKGRSFPSNHTSNNFAAATIFLLFYRRWGWLGFLAFIPAAIVGYSRIYSASHWPSDVFISIFLGIGLGWLMVHLLNRLWKAKGAKLAPALFAKYPCLTGIPSDS